MSHTKDKLSVGHLRPQLDVLLLLLTSLSLSHSKAMKNNVVYREASIMSGNGLALSTW